MPRAFWKELSPRAFIFEWSRSIARAIGEHDYLVRKTAKNSVVSLATTQETALRLRRIGCSDVQEMAQCALNQNQRELLLADVDGDGHKGIRFLSIGRALHWKGFDLGLRAFAEADLPSSEYWLLVNGSGRVSLERLANELGIAEKVTFLEPVGSLEEVYGIIKSCDVLVHPALHEAFGNVVQEAMAAKVPVICLDIGGPATQVMSQFGYCAKSKNPQVAISSIKEAMIELSGNRDVLKEMGEAARSHTIKNMRWERLAENLSSIYCQISVNEHRL